METTATPIPERVGPKGPVAVDPVPIASVSVGSVVEVEAGRLVVDAGGRGPREARVATAGPYRPGVGDEVLVALDERGAAYVIGVLRALRLVHDGAGVATRDGSTATVEEEDGHEVLRVRGAGGRLLFEHRPQERRSVVHAPEGDLCLRADAGDLTLQAARAVRVEAPEIRVDAGRRARVSTPDGELDLDGPDARLRAGTIDARAARARLRADHARLSARRLLTVADRVKHVATEVLETHAGRLVERARESYRDVEELSQTRAGRLKLVAERTLSVLGLDTRIKARRDVKVLGDKIYLG